MSLLTGEIDESSSLYKSLLCSEPVQEVESRVVAPQPGWCVKTKLENGSRKVFLNICTSNLVLKPKDLPASEVQQIIASEDPTKFRVPMGIGEVHKEKDKSGEDADAYDIVVHPEFFEKCKREAFFKELLLMLVFDGLENKYNLQLSREFKILKNRKSIGTIQTQNVRSKSTPVIMEMDPTMYELEKEALHDQKKTAGISEISTKKLALEPPKYTITKDPDVGHPEFLVAELLLPNETDTDSCTLDVGEDRLVFYSKYYHLDIDLPYDVNNDETGAQFHWKNKKLTVTMAVLAQK